MSGHSFEKLDGSKFTFGKGWKDDDFDLRRLSTDPLDKENRFNYLKVLGLLYADAPATQKFLEGGKSLRMSIYDTRQVSYLERYLRRNDAANRNGADKTSYDTDFWVSERGNYTNIRNPNFKPYFLAYLPELSPSERLALLKSFIPHTLIKSFSEHQREGRHEKLYSRYSNPIVAENLNLLMHLERIPFFPFQRTEWRNFGKTEGRRDIISFWFIDPEALGDYLNEEFASVNEDLGRYKPFDDADSVLAYVVSLSRAATIETAKHEGRAAPTQALEARNEFDEIRKRITRIRTMHRELTEKQKALLSRKDSLDYLTDKEGVEKGLQQANGMQPDIDTLGKELEVLQEARDELYEVLFSRKKPRRRKGGGFNYQREVYMGLERHRDRMVR